MKTPSIKYFAPVALAALISCSAPKETNELIAEAKAFVAQGDSKSAVITLKNVIKKDPKLGEARFVLGKTYFDQGNLLSAEKELTKALELGVTSPELFILLAKHRLSTNDYEEVVTLLSDKIFKSNTDKITTAVLLGQAYLALDKRDEAELQFNQANSLDNESPESLYSQALLTSYDGKTDEALTMLNRITQSSSVLPESWLLKGSIESKINKFHDASLSFIEFSKLNPKHLNVKTLIAHNQIRAGEYEAARIIIDQLLQQTKRHPTVNLLAAQLALVDKNYTKAKELANNVLIETNNGLAQIISGLSDYYLGNNEQAYYQLNAIADGLPPQHKVHHVLAVLQLKLGYNDELTKTLANIDDVDAASAELFSNIGTSLARQGNVQGANKLFERAVKISPENAKIKTQQGILKVLNTDDSGIKDLQDAIALAPELKEANIALAMTYVKQGRLVEATQIADNWLKQQPSDVNALLLRGSIATSASNIEEAKSYYNQANVIAPDNVIPLFNLAVLYTNEKDDNNSIKALEKLLVIDQEYAPAYRLLLNNLVKLGQEDQIAAKLSSLIKDFPKAVWPRVIMSRRLNSEQKIETANALLEELTAYTDLPNIYFAALANNYFSQKNFSAVSDLFSKWQKAQPNNIQAYSMHIEVLERLKQHKNALDIVQVALAKPSLQKDFKLRSFESYFLLLTNQVEQASKKANTLSKIKPDDSFLLRIQGQIALAQQKYELAENYLSESHLQQQNTYTALFLATALKQQGKNKSAIKFLESELEKFPKNSAYKKFLAEMYIAESPEMAIASYSSVIENGSNDPVTLNNLAWLLYKNGDIDKAYQYAIKAQSIAPKHPRILDTLGVIELKSNKLASAIKTLSNANKIAPKDSEIAVHLAQAYHANKEHDKVKKLLASLSDEDKQKWQDVISKM